MQQAIHLDNLMLLTIFIQYVKKSCCGFLYVILASFSSALQLPILEKHSGSRVGSSFRHVVSIIHPEPDHSSSLCNS